MVETLFYDKPHRKNMKNLQTKLYLALFSDFEYFVPLQSSEIFFRVSSEKTYCIKKGWSDRDSDIENKGGRRGIILTKILKTWREFPGLDPI